MVELAAATNAALWNDVRAPRTWCWCSLPPSSVCTCSSAVASPPSASPITGSGSSPASTEPLATPPSAALPLHALAPVERHRRSLQDLWPQHSHLDDDHPHLRHRAAPPHDRRKSQAADKEAAIARLFAPVADNASTPNFSDRRPSVTSLGSQSVSDAYFSPRSARASLPPPLDAKALATRQALERVFSVAALPTPPPPPLPATCTHTTHAMADAPLSSSATLHKALNGQPPKTRTRSQSSAAILSPPHSPPRSSNGRSKLVAAAAPFEPSSLPAGSIWSGGTSPVPSSAGASPLAERFNRAIVGSVPGRYGWDFQAGGGLLLAGVEERQGRSASRIAPGTGDWSGAKQRGVSVGSCDSLPSSVHSGIALSNMSPFTGTSMLPPVPIGQGPGVMFNSARGRESSLGAVGTGRTTGVRDGWMSGGRSLTNDLDESDELAAPTRSGATSRRHSVAAFTGRSQIGFDIPGIKPLNGSSSRMSILGRGIAFGSGSSALTDDDLLASDLNCLHLNLEAHKQQQDREQRQQYGNVALTSPIRPPSLPQPPANAPMTRPNRAPSFSAGDPFSASAQASRYFAQQAQLLQQIQTSGTSPVQSRFPFGAIPAPAATTMNTSPWNQANTFGTANLPPAFSPTGNGPLSPFGAPVGSSTLQTTPGHLNTLSQHSIFGPNGGPGPTTSMGSLPSNMDASGAELSELGKGVPLHQVPMSCPLYIVEFKAGRTDLFYLPDPAMALEIRAGDLVVVEADRGKDLGKVLHDQISIEDVQAFQQHQVEIALAQLAAAPHGGAVPPNPASISRMTKEIHPKKIYNKASSNDAQQLMLKAQDEAKALALCRSKALSRGLPMEITAAEWQWDRRKLTFFFIADKRVDFRELVRELFRIWKTRIWMCSVNS